MVKVLGLFLFMFSLQVSAGVHTGTIAQIDLPRTRQELPLIYLSDGMVLKIKPEHKQDLNDYVLAQRSQANLKIVVNHKRQIESVENLGKIPRTSDTRVDEPFVNYEPTVLATEEDAKMIFRSLRRGARSWSQCYNRAHIWSYESKNNHNLNSMKVFMFYTRKYIREYDFGWWFHVSPFTYVSGEEGAAERVLDFKFTRSPLPMKKWTDLFMQNKAVCPPITKYSDYENHQEEAYCYLYKASMFYYQPLDLDANETRGAVKTDWINWEVKNAYRNGFGVW